MRKEKGLTTVAFPCYVTVGWSFPFEVDLLFFSSFWQPLTWHKRLILTFIVVDSEAHPCKLPLNMCDNLELKQEVNVKDAPCSRFIQGVWPAEEQHNHQSSHSCTHGGSQAVCWTLSQLLRAKAERHAGQVASSSQGIIETNNHLHAHPQPQSIKSSQFTSHACFGDWKEGRKTQPQTFENV